MVELLPQWYALDHRPLPRTIGGHVKTGMGDGDWDLLLRRIRNKTCTPFLGAGASAHRLPTGTELALRWADEVGYPLPERGDLAQVAQYMAITEDPQSPKERVSELCTNVDPAEALQPGDSYDVISDLDLPLYITTNYDDLLLHALRNKRKNPQPLLCPWHRSLHEQAGETYDYVPSPEKPVVYYLHGSAQELASIVITEDDYLDFILWVTQHWKEQPNISHVATAVRGALGRNSLLFIGYSQKDWTFRVLMRTIREAGLNLGLRHVAVQLSPLNADATEVDQEKVSEYLTRYFTRGRDNPVTLYWGTANAFLKDLQTRLAETKGR
jgi:SIR2-like domain